ncbi:MAG TPA: hypothetical protein VMY43_10840 [Methanothrix sp.]|nr:hypothetical protein [Methanothrix sp.]
MLPETTPGQPQAVIAAGARIPADARSRRLWAGPSGLAALSSGRACLASDRTQGQRGLSSPRARWIWIGGQAALRGTLHARSGARVLLELVNEACSAGSDWTSGLRSLVI